MKSFSRFPILAALFMGPSKHKPPAKVMLEKMQEELQDMAVDPIFWTDDQGTCHHSKVFLTVCLSDAPQKQEFMNHRGPGARWFCPYCYYEGRQINRIGCPNVWAKTNKLRRMKDDTRDSVEIRSVE